MSYFHNDDEGHFGCKDVPELHGMSILPLVARGEAVVTIPGKDHYIYTLSACRIYIQIYMF